MDGQDRVVGGRYRLQGRLGAGAMGAVWRAEDLVLGRHVAVKEVVFPPGTRPEEAEVLRARTRREARSAARLDHPSAVTVFDVVEEDGRPWLVMELVEARTLADVVTEDGPLSPARTAHIGLAVLGALEAAHRQGIVHRDVKPGNVMITEPGRIVLTDFGIATSAEDASLTGTGLLLGSPAYIAPERARGNAPGPASDLWSLGATLFTAVEGRPPYDGTNALETVTSVVTGAHAPYVAAGPLRPVLDGLLVKDPANRLDAAGARALLLRVAAATAAGSAATVTEPVPVAARTDHATTAMHVEDVRAEVRAQAQQRPAAPRAPAPAQERPPLQRPSQVERPSRVVRPAVAPAADAPARHPRPHRPNLVPLLAAVVLLVVAGVGLLLAVRGDQGAGGTAAPSVSSSPDPSGPASPAPAVRPAGFVGYEDPAQGWTVATPAGWTTTDSRDARQLKDDETRSTLRVRAPGATGDDATALADVRAGAYGSLGQYVELSRGPGELGGQPTADVEFTFFADGVSLHALSRSFVLDGQAYELYWQTNADDWGTARGLFDEVAATFRPAESG